VRHNITIQRPFTNRRTSNPRRFSGQSAAHSDSLAYSHTGTLRASPDNRLRRTDSLVYSLAGIHASPENRLCRADSLA